MKELTEIQEKLSKERPIKWESIPDIDLYMDQVIYYMKRQHIADDGQEILTAAMVNNYMKKALLPRAKGKRYNREHIAYLTAICALKQILPMDQIGHLLNRQVESQGIESFYEKYCDLLDQSLCQAAGEVHEHMEENEILDLILKLAVSSYAQKLACDSLLNAMARK